MVKVYEKSWGKNDKTLFLDLVRRYLREAWLDSRAWWIDGGGYRSFPLVKETETKEAEKKAGK